MTTEYRPGIPSHAHIEAATRLGIEWEEVRPHCSIRRWRFQIRGDELWCDFWSDVSGWDRDLQPLSSGRIADRADIEHYTFRPIRPDGTLVDWETLDAEVARVAQQGQPQGFRATLFGTGRASDFLARWAVYQELKPLYDLVDGAHGEVAMPRDVEVEWATQATGVDGNTRCQGRNIRIGHDANSLYILSSLEWRPTTQGSYSTPLRNFSAVLDAVAERRVAERMQGQAQATTVTSAQSPTPPEPRRFADVRPDRHGWRWWRVRELDGSTWRFSNRSSDIHALSGAAALSGIWLDRTVIPTDEQGNPVSWGSIGQPVGQVCGSQQPFFDARTGVVQPGQFSNNLAAMPVTEAAFRQVLASLPATPLTQVHTVLREREEQEVRARLAREGIDPNKPSISTQPAPLPRFTADELDDVDHSRTTKLDQATLRRGRLPTVEQIAKYREVRAKRTGGTVADALKESRIDCEVAKYVLERWAGGLGDADTVLLLRAAGCIVPLKDTPQHSIRAFDPKQVEVDRRSQDFLRTHNATLDISEKPSSTVQRERQEAEERRQRLAQLRQRLAAERAAQPQEVAKESEASRFDLIEPDPQADPTASIRAWEARQAAAKVRPIPAPPRIAKPAAAPRRPAIEVVDAEVDGLSRVDVVTVLVGRAFNGGC